MSWTRTEQQRRQPDHRLHGHPLHRLRPATATVEAAAGRPPRPSTGSTNGTSYTFTVTADQRDRQRPAVRHPSSAVTPADTIFDFAHARDDRLRRFAPPSSSGSSSAPNWRARSPASASTRPPPTPAPTSAACGAPPARCWPRPPSPTKPPPAGSRSTSPRPSRSPPTRPTSPPTWHPKATTPTPASGFASARHQPAAARARELHQRQRRLRLQRIEHLPDQHLQSHQLLGRRRLRTRRRSPRARSPTSRATAGPGRRRVTWSAPTERRTGRPNTRSPPTSAPKPRPATTDHGTPPATSDTITGLTTGHALHLHRAGLQLERRRAGLRTLQRRHADGRRPRRRHRPASRPAPATRPGAGELERTGQQRRQPDHADTRSPPTSGTDRPDARRSHRRAAATSTTINGLDQRHQLHVHRHRDQRGRARARRPSASNAVTSRSDTIFDFATPATVDSGDTASVELGRQVHLRSGRHGHRASASTRRPPTPAPTSAACGAPPGRCSPRPPSPTKPPPAGSRSTSPAPSRSPPTRPTWPPTWRPKATTPTRLRRSPSAVTNPPLHALANPTSANGVYAYSATSIFPTSTYKATNYWVDVDFEPTPAARPGDQRQRHRRHRLGERDLERARRRRTGEPNTRSPPTSAPKPRPPTTVTGSPPATEHDDHRADNRHHLHVHRAGVQRQRRRPGLGSHRTRSRPTGADRPRRRPPAWRPAPPPARRRSAGANPPATAAARSPDTRSPPTSARAPRRRSKSPPADLGDRHRAHQRHQPTPSPSRRPTQSGASPPRQPRNAVTPQDTIFDFATPATIDSGDTNSIELGVKFSSEARRHGHRHPLLQGHHQHRHPHRQPVDAGGTLLASATFTQRDAPPAGSR